MHPSHKWLLPITALLVAAGCHETRSTANVTAPADSSASVRTTRLQQVAAANASRNHIASHSLHASGPVRSSIASTADITTFGTREDFEKRTVQLTDTLSRFENVVDILPTPFTTKGVSYTTPQNFVMGADFGFGYSTPVICYGNFTPMQGQLGDEGTHYSLFGFDLTVLSLNDVQPVTITLTTNRGTYTFSDVSAAKNPDATFFGFATATAGEYFTGFQIDAGASDNAPCLKNVTVGSAQPLDATAPVIVPTITGTAGTNGWYTSDVALSWAVTDAESPVSGTTGCNAVSITADQAETTYTCSATSLGGTANASVSVKVDRTVPTVSGDVTSGTRGNNGWYTSRVGVTWTPGTAGPSGLVQSDACAATTLSADSPSHTFSCVVTSGAGIASAPASLTVKRDATRPVVAYSGNAGSYTVADQVSIGCSATDNLSGIASSTCLPVTGYGFAFPVGSNSFSASATDRAGNTSATASARFTVSVDRTSLCTLVSRWTSNEGVASSLCVKLAHADYGAFRNEVRAQTDKKIPAANAAILLHLVDAL